MGAVATGAAEAEAGHGGVGHRGGHVGVGALAAAAGMEAWSVELVAAAGLADTVQDLVEGEGERGADALLEDVLDGAGEAEEEPAGAGGHLMNLRNVF